MPRTALADRGIPEHLVPAFREAAEFIAWSGIKRTARLFAGALTCVYARHSEEPPEDDTIPADFFVHPDLAAIAASLTEEEIEAVRAGYLSWLKRRAEAVGEERLADEFYELEKRYARRAVMARQRASVAPGNSVAVSAPRERTPRRRARATRARPRAPALASKDPPPLRPCDGVRPRLLAGVLSIHDVRDVEGYAAVILMDSLRRFGARLNEHDRESLHAYLIALIWELGAKWDRRGSFAQYAGSIAGLRVVDWFRSERGDQRFEKWHAEVIVDSDAVARVDLADEDDVCELAVANAFQLPRCALSPRASETLEVIERGIAVSWTDRTMLRRRLHLRDELAALDVSSELVR